MPVLAALLGLGCSVLLSSCSSNRKGFRVGFVAIKDIPDVVGLFHVEPPDPL